MQASCVGRSKNDSKTKAVRSSSHLFWAGDYRVWCSVHRTNMAGYELFGPSSTGVRTYTYADLMTIRKYPAVSLNIALATTN